MASSSAKLVKLQFQKGIRRESTEYSEEGNWYDGNHVRFRNGRPENLRGYVKKSTTALLGTPRDQINWSDNDTFKRTMLGTEVRLYEFDTDTYYDVTPIVSIRTLTSVINTTLNSTKVSVASVAHNVKSGDYVILSSVSDGAGGSTIGGLDFNGKTYKVSVSSGATDIFCFDASTSATSTKTGGGVAELKYLLPTGTSTAIQGLGYGAGVFQAGVSTNGLRAWNQPASSSDIITQISQWSMDNWGEDVVATRRGSNIFYFDTDASVTPERAYVVTAAPTINNFIIVSPNDRHLISLGTTSFVDGVYNPLLVRWSDQNNLQNWTPSVSSTSGENIITDGTKLMGGVRSRNAINLWTDNALWAQSFVGGDFVFKFQQLGTNCGLISPHAAVDYDGMSIWMGDSNFYMYDGSVRNLDCTVRRFVFDDMNATQKDKIYAGVNSEFKEVIWLYPSADATECDRYVIFSPTENYWTFGEAIWTTYDDKDVYGNTITTGVDNNISYLYDNEPVSIFDGDGVALSSFIESAPFDLGDGTEMMFLDRIVPDFVINDGSLKIKVFTRDYPQGDETEKGPFAVGKTTNKIDMRARGRQAKIRVSCADPLTSWRYGAIRASLQPDGGR
jgi:hypothetical protein